MTKNNTAVIRGMMAGQIANADQAIVESPGRRSNPRLRGGWCHHASK